MKTAIAANPAIYTFHHAYPVRVLRDAQGNPLFHANDLCAVLEYANPRDALRRHVEPEDVVKRDTLSVGGNQAANYVTEPGMWSLVLGSETPRAREVKRWVTSEVLPAIRKTGTYSLPVVSTRHAPGAEVLDANDLANVRRVIWRITANQEDESGWVRMCWTSLRRTAGIGHGDPFCVDHLPMMAEELARLCASADTVRAATNRVSQSGLATLSKGGALEDVVREIRKTASTARAVTDPLKLARWTQMEFDRMVKRLPAVMEHPEAGELQPA